MATKATVIYVGGLGDCPSVAACSLQERLEKQGYSVIVPETAWIHDHDDRIYMTLHEYYRAVKGEGPVFLIGQSAGGSAVRVTAEVLHHEGSHRLAGVILLSPAMPRSVDLLWLRSSTPATQKLMKRHWREILSGEMIDQTAVEFESRVAPLAPEVRDEVLASRQPVPGAEARTLALWPPKMGIYVYPTLHVWGSIDACIDPKAQATLSRKLQAMTNTEPHMIVGAGHSTLASAQREAVLGIIEDWIARRMKGCSNKLTLEDAYALVGSQSPHIVDCNPPHVED